MKLLARAVALSLALSGGACVFAKDCTLVDYRIPAKNRIALSCDDIGLKLTPRPVKLTEITSAGVLTGAPIPGSLKQSESDPTWLDISLASDLSPGKQYLVEDPDANPYFDPYTISTEAAATISIVNPPERTNCQKLANPSIDQLLKVQSQIALDASTLKGATLQIQDVATLLIGLTQRTTTGFSSIGLADACVKSYAAGAGEMEDLRIDGLKNIFGESIDATGTITSDTAPADKQSATYYVKLDAQAGQGQKPGYTVQASVAPKMWNIGSGWYLMPSADVDLGFSKADDPTTTTNMIKVGIGAEHYFSERFIEFKPSLQYETDRHGNHRNLLFDGEAQYFGRGWRRSIAQRNYDEYIRRLNPNRPDVKAEPVPDKPDQVHIYKSGYLFELLAGIEAGGALSSDTATSSDAQTTVVVPTYAIARFKPTLSFTGEVRRASLSLQAIPRYLFTHESVTRETPTPDPTDSTKSIQKIYTRSISGWHVFGTASFLWKLDPAGHFGWSITEKIGSEPPNFDHVNQVESGLVIIY